MGRKILVTATTFPRWKDDTEPGFVFYLSNLLSKKGHKVTALVPHHFNAKRYELMGNIKVYRFPYFYPYKLQKLCYDGGILENMKKSIFAKIQAPFLFLAELINMKKIIQKEKIDLIHAHWILPQGVLAALFKKSLICLILLLCMQEIFFQLKVLFLDIFQKWPCKIVTTALPIALTLKMLF